MIHQLPPRRDNAAEFPGLSVCSVILFLPLSLISSLINSIIHPCNLMICSSNVFLLLKKIVLFFHFLQKQSRIFVVILDFASILYFLKTNCLLIGTLMFLFVAFLSSEDVWCLLLVLYFFFLELLSVLYL